MTDIVSVAVNAHIDIEGVNFKPTKVKVTRGMQSAGHATIKGIIDNPYELEEEQIVKASVTNDQMSGSGFDSRTQLFIGELESAQINDKQIVTVEAYGPMFQLFNFGVQLNTTQPTHGSTVARKLVEEAEGFSLVDDPSNGGYQDVFIADQLDFPNQAKSEYIYGTSKQSEPLYTAMRDIADRIGAVLWVDRYGVIRLEPYPHEHKVYQVPFITKLNTGDETIKKKQTIVKGGSATGQLGQEAYSVYQEVSSTSNAYLPGGSGSNKPSKNLQHDQIVTKKGTETYAVEKQYKETMQTSNGRITTIGNPEIELYDRLYIPEIDKLASETEASNFVNSELDRENPNPNLSRIFAEEANITDFDFDSRFSVKSVTHIIDSQEGYTTEVDLSPEPLTVIEGIVSQSEVTQKKKEAVENSAKEIDADFWTYLQSIGAAFANSIFISQ